MHLITDLAQNILTLQTSMNYRTFYTMPHVGDYKFSARSDDFHGWLKCDGRVLSNQDFPALYEVIGTNFGTGGGDTFRLPNTQGRVPAAVGTSTASNHPLGQAVGEETHVLTVAELPSHNHTITDPGHIHTGDKYNGNNQSTDNAFGTETAADNSITTGSVNSAYTGITINNTGSNVPHNTMQPTLFIGSMYIFSGLRDGYIDPIPTAT